MRTAYDLWHGLAKTVLNTSGKNPNQTFISEKKRGKVRACVKDIRVTLD
jgi:hypothetical protein